MSCLSDFSLLPSPTPSIEGSPSCLALGYWEKRQMFQWGKDREEVRIFTLRSVARSLCSAQRRPEGKRVFLGRLGLSGPYYMAQALGFSLRQWHTAV